MDSRQYRGERSAWIGGMIIYQLTLLLSLLWVVITGGLLVYGLVMIICSGLFEIIFVVVVSAFYEWDAQARKEAL